MVVLGQWPYQHTVTLDQLRRQANAGAYYFVDEDRILSRAKALDLEKSGYILDDIYLTVMSEDMQTYVQAFMNQDFPAPIHTSVISMLKTNANPHFAEVMNKVKNSGAVLLVNDQDGEIMDDIGAQWNDALGIWILDGVALRILREKRRQKTDGKIEIRQDKGGVLAEISGDVTPHISLLREVGGKYDEDKNIWFIPMSSVHKVMHITSI